MSIRWSQVDNTLAHRLKVCLLGHNLNTMTVASAIEKVPQSFSPFCFDNVSLSSLWRRNNNGLRTLRSWDWLSNSYISYTKCSLSSKVSLSNNSRNILLNNNGLCIVSTSNFPLVHHLTMDLAKYFDKLIYMITSGIGVHWKHNCHS